MLQYTGVLEVTWHKEKEKEERRFLNLSSEEKAKVIADGWKISKEEETDEGVLFTAERTQDVGKNKICCVPS